MLNLLSMSRLCHKMLHESKRVCFPRNRHSCVCLPRNRHSCVCFPRNRHNRVCLPRNRHNRVCLPRNRQRIHRCSVNVDILTEFEKRRSDSMCEGVNRATGHWKMTWTLLHKHLFLCERGSVIYWLCIIGSCQNSRA